MRIALAVDAVVPPLTGIGRYAWELAKHFSEFGDPIRSVRFFFADQLITDARSVLMGNAAAGLRPRWLPRVMSSNRRIRNWRMQRCLKGYLFHAPNYFLPDKVERGVVTVHDLSVFRFPETHPAERLLHFERSFAATLRRAAHLITDSEAIRQEVASHFGWSLDRITAVPLGVSREFRPRPADELIASLASFGLVPGGYALCVSTLEPRKRIDKLLVAYAMLPSALRARYPLVLIGGPGWLSDTLHSAIARAESEGWLRYLGFVPEAQLPALYAGAHAFFMPSKYEGFGLPVLEALASGVPTLTSNTSSLPEVAGDAAWLVESDDHDALRDGLEAVLVDDAWRSAAIARGLSIARGMTWEQCAVRTLDVYRHVAAS
ncbi:glycosyltransferase family 1 protein [Burkholderia glumae]|uniref:glycosyltransferase family 4 protein n=1 Tax=Burkholderia glumae TaxID=337 RepID=UPI000F5FA043|nr:glycosyltransferase family 1 protein [Burkholderia glumae]MCQ0031951.1 glycosyltransferase family 4 protein [Burkholderia glumae]MCQ0037051.1 glycosyltransferase family 4 protein [Burkholderia glumae]QJW78489.1 glycosyltransferase family 4 protein [Burkholderia glumae]RQZ74841.1 glycosyltransferase family 1 protein [Burkholderia glumae]UVS83441.1 glycosyltransferase family 1 protein [Burkholderia glumae]